MNTSFPSLPLLPLVIAGAITVLHFWMKIRLLNNGLPVKWLMWFGDDWRMWQQYREHGRTHNWAMWPFYLYWTLWAALIASLVAAIPTLRRGG